MTPEEREELVKHLEAKESGALAGQAQFQLTKNVQKTITAKKVSPKVLKVSPALMKQAIARVCTPKTNAELCLQDQTCGDLPNGCGGVVQCGNLCGDLKKPYCYVNKCLSSESELCTDSDGGMDYYVKGTVLGLFPDYSQNPQGDLILQERTDTCFPKNAQTGATAGTPTSHCSPGDCGVLEFYCGESKSDFNSIICPNGCKDGACCSEAGCPTSISPEATKQVAIQIN